MQYQSEGTYLKDKSVFELEHKFWLKHQDRLKEQRRKAKARYNKR